MLRRFIEGRLVVPSVVRPRVFDLARSKPLIPCQRNAFSLFSMSITSAGGASKNKLYDALLLDAGGTLLHTASSVAETYATIGEKYGIKATASEISRGFKRAFSSPWPEKLRYQGDGRPFWRHVVVEATGFANNDYFEEVYEHFAQVDAWRVPPGAYEVLYKLKDSGVKLAVVSNFDTRLRKLLEGLNLLSLFDAVIISAEVGYEKPAAETFRAALDKIGIEAGRAVHVGDDLKADKDGANSVGIDCWLWGSDVKTFEEIYHRIMPGPLLKSEQAL